MPSHPKFVAAGPQAGWLFVCGLCYSNEHLTDGFIPGCALAVVGPGIGHARRLAARLVEAGLWHAVEGGWQVHGYREYQRNADEIRDRRERDRQRKASVRTDATRSPRGQAAESSRTPAGVREVDVEIEGRRQKAEQIKTPAALRADVLDCFAYWQEKCGHPNAKLTADREAKIKARLREGYSVHDIRKAIDGAARGAFVNDSGQRFDDIELICRKGSKLEDFMRRMATNVTPLRKESPSDLWRAINGTEDYIEGDAS